MGSNFSNGAMTLKDFTKWAGIGYTKTYAEAKIGKLTLTKIGRRTLILRSEAERWLASYSGSKSELV